MAYTRDASDRIVQRNVVDSGATTTRFGFSGPGDTPDLTMDLNNTVVHRTLALPGGVVVSLPTAGRGHLVVPEHPR